MKPIEEKHSHPITVWMKPEMKRALVAISKKTGLPMAELIRNSLKEIRIPKEKANGMH